MARAAKVTEAKQDLETKQFQADLLQSVRDMKAGRSARMTAVAVTRASEARSSVGLSQSEFAKLLGVSVRTLQDWEQGRREPTGAAQTLLRIAEQHPRVLRGVTIPRQSRGLSCCEPLKAAKRGRLRSPYVWCHLTGGGLLP